MAITRLSGGTTPPNGSDPRTFPAIWNDAVDDIEALELPITADRIADGAVTAPKLAKTAGAVMVFDDATARTTAIPTPVEGMVTYLSDVNQVQAFTGSAFTAVGSILQVVSVNKTDQFSTSSTSYTDVTGVAATITPSSASSKILVMVTISAGTVDNARAAHLQLVGGALSFVGDAASNRVRATVSTGTRQADFRLDNQPVSFGITVLDSPATTSATTYKMEIRVGGGAGIVRVNSNGIDVDNSGNARTASSITLMEVAG